MFTIKINFSKKKTAKTTKNLQKFLKTTGNSLRKFLIKLPKNNKNKPSIN